MSTPVTVEVNDGVHDPDVLLTPAEVAAMFGVDPKTVTRWARAGKIGAVRTLGGHRRYRAGEVRALVTGTVPMPRPPGL
jgi:excisionase family DNA binding protein